MRDPRWTVVLGGLVVIAAMIVTVVLASRPGVSAGTRALLFLGMLIVMIVGGALTLRDWSRPRRRR